MNSIRKRAKVQLGFKYDPNRYLNKKFIKDAAPVKAEEEVKAPPPVANGRRKLNMKVNLDFKYDPKKYENKTFIKKNAPIEEVKS